LDYIFKKYFILLTLAITKAQQDNDGGITITYPNPQATFFSSKDLTKKIINPNIKQLIDFKKKLDLALEEINPNKKFKN
jgi:hypothetical protein